MLHSRFKKATTASREKILKEGTKKGIEKGKQEGLQKGRQEGMGKGRKAEKLTIARKLFNLNLPFSVIQEVTGVRESDIDKTYWTFPIWGNTYFVTRLVFLPWKN